MSVQNIYTISQPNPIQKPAGCRWEIYRSPVGERQATVGFIAILRQSTGLPAVTAGSLDNRRRDTGGASAENLVISIENQPVAEQSPGGGRQATTG